MSDAVNHPSHYADQSAKLEPIDVLRYAPFDLGNALKYIIRAGHKNSELEDWRKAQRYMFWVFENYKNSNQVEYFLKNYGLLLKKFKPFSLVTTSSEAMFLMDISQLIDKNIERLEKGDESKR